MGKLNFSALKVRQTAIAQIANGKTRRTPCWLDVIYEVPPAAVLTRNTVVPHTLQRQRMVTDPVTGKVHTVVKTSKKGRHSVKPRKIVYEEDALRRRFYEDHPWELARPRVILETWANDYKQHDWSKLLQSGKRLDGESVIQRQLWLLNNVPNMSVGRAYGIARNEFYSARLKEELERSVAHEEALATGAYFGPRMLEVGMQLENNAYDRWKEWAEQELMIQEAKLAAFAGDAGIGEEDLKILETVTDVDEAAATETKDGATPKQKETLASAFQRIK
ncbi:mitochondrial ribosomal small subunit component [Ascosphaera aggregata]|nr:mitochondrial ribosomal small subunit component [Ascosphaera aggregata]